MTRLKDDICANIYITCIRQNFALAGFSFDLIETTRQPSYFRRLDALRKPAIQPILAIVGSRLELPFQA